MVAWCRSWASASYSCAICVVCNVWVGDCGVGGWCVGGVASASYSCLEEGVCGVSGTVWHGVRLGVGVPHVHTRADARAQHLRNVWWPAHTHTQTHLARGVPHQHALHRVVAPDLAKLTHVHTHTHTKARMLTGQPRLAALCIGDQHRPRTCRPDCGVRVHHAPQHGLGLGLEGGVGCRPASICCRACCPPSICCRAASHQHTDVDAFGKICLL